MSDSDDTHCHPDQALEPLVGREVVVDMASEYVYIGTLSGYDRAYLHLERADVHDLRDTATTRENYIVDSRRFGVRCNRERVMVRVEGIVSISALDDVVV